MHSQELGAGVAEIHKRAGSWGCRASRKIPGPQLKEDSVRVKTKQTRNQEVVKKEF